MHRKLRLLHATAVVAGALALAGCSRGTLGPGSNVIQDPMFLTDRSGPGLTSDPGSVEPLAGSAVIDGSQGGQLKVGRFTLTVPAGAFKGPATISIRVPNPTQVRCQLEITPASANQFDVPVILRTDCSGTNGLDPALLTEIWFDETSGVWRQVPGSRPDIVEFDVIAPLTHFSDYGVIELLDSVDGKAGW